MTDFTIDNEAEMFLEQQINTLEWFLEDHVTLKKIQLCHHNNKLHFKTYYNWKQYFTFFFFLLK